MKNDEYIQFKGRLDVLLAKLPKEHLFEKWLNDSNVQVSFDYDSIIPWNGFLQANCKTPIGFCSTTFGVGLDSTQTDSLRNEAIQRILEGNVDIHLS